MAEWMAHSALHIADIDAKWNREDDDQCVVVTAAAAIRWKFRACNDKFVRILSTVQPVWVLMKLPRICLHHRDGPIDVERGSEWSFIYGKCGLSNSERMERIAVESERKQGEKTSITIQRLTPLLLPSLHGNSSHELSEHKTNFRFSFFPLARMRAARKMLSMLMMFMRAAGGKEECVEMRNDGKIK